MQLLPQAPLAKSGYFLLGLVRVICLTKFQLGLYPHNLSVRNVYELTRRRIKDEDLETVIVGQGDEIPHHPAVCCWFCHRGAS